MSNVGLKVGKLTVIEDLDNNKQDSKHFVKCKCECGNCIEITLREFKRGRKKSCGCLQNGSVSKVPISARKRRHRCDD